MQYASSVDSPLFMKNLLQEVLQRLAFCRRQLARLKKLKLRWC
jgi:hypothetical protein